MLMSSKVHLDDFNMKHLYQMQISTLPLFPFSENRLFNQENVIQIMEKGHSIATAPLYDFNGGCGSVGGKKDEGLLMFSLQL